MAKPGARVEVMGGSKAFDSKEHKVLKSCMYLCMEIVLC